MNKIAPLPSTFMLMSILGFIISAIYIAPKEMTWGFTFQILFAVMFIAAFISMTKAPVDDREFKKTKK